MAGGDYSQAVMRGKKLTLQEAQTLLVTMQKTTNNHPCYAGGSQLSQRAPPHRGPSAQSPGAHPTSAWPRSLQPPLSASPHQSSYHPSSPQGSNPLKRKAGEPCHVSHPAPSSWPDTPSHKSRREAQRSTVRSPTRQTSQILPRGSNTQHQMSAHQQLSPSNAPLLHELVSILGRQEQGTQIGGTQFGGTQIHNIPENFGTAELALPSITSCHQGSPPFGSSPHHEADSRQLMTSAGGSWQGEFSFNSASPLLPGGGADMGTVVGLREGASVRAIEGASIRSSLQEVETDFLQSILLMELLQSSADVLGNATVQLPPNDTGHHHQDSGVRPGSTVHPETSLSLPGDGHLATVPTLLSDLSNASTMSQGFAMEGPQRAPGLPQASRLQAQRDSAASHSLYGSSLASIVAQELKEPDADVAGARLSQGEPGVPATVGVGVAAPKLPMQDVKPGSESEEDWEEHKGEAPATNDEGDWTKKDRVTSERERRHRIRDGLRELRKAFGGRGNNAVMLKQAVAYIQRLEAEVGGLRDKARAADNAVKKETQVLSSLEDGDEEGAPEATLPEAQSGTPMVPS